MDGETARSLLRFAGDSSPALREPGGKAVLERMDARHAEMEQALEWFRGQGLASEAFQLASALVPFWMATKRLEEGTTWFERLLALPGGEDVDRARASFDAGYLAFWQGDDARSSALQERALELGRRTKEPTVTALALVGLARIALRTDVEAARRLCREALSVTEGTADRRGRSSAMHVLAVAAQMSGDLNEARDLMSQRIALAREMNDIATISIESNNLSMVERQLGSLVEAETLARQALEISHQRGDELAISWNLNQLAASTASLGELARAATLLAAADATIEAAGGAWPPDELEHHERTEEILAGALPPAELERARAAGRAMSAAEAVAFALGIRWA